MKPVLAWPTQYGQSSSSLPGALLDQITTAVHQRHRHSSRSPETTLVSGDPTTPTPSKVGCLPRSPRLALLPTSGVSHLPVNLARPTLGSAPLGFWPDGSAPELPGATPPRGDHPGSDGADNTARRDCLPKERPQLRRHARPVLALQKNRR